MGTQARDFESLGWTMLALQEGGSMFDMLMAMLDAQVDAHSAGLEAGLAGLVAGENPFVCCACRTQWARGHAEGVARALFIAQQCGKPVLTVGLPL